MTHWNEDPDMPGVLRQAEALLTTDQLREFIQAEYSRLSALRHQRRT